MLDALLGERGEDRTADRDVALVVARQVPASDVTNALRSGAGPLLESIRLFDVYDRMGPDERSLAFRLRAIQKLNKGARVRFRISAALPRKPAQLSGRAACISRYAVISIAAANGRGEGACAHDCRTSIDAAAACRHCPRA